MWITFFFWWFQVKSIIYEFIIHQQMLGWQSQWIRWIWDTFLCDAIIEYNLCQIRISFYQKPEIKDTHPFEDCTIHIYSLDRLSSMYVVYKGIVKALGMKTCVQDVCNTQNMTNPTIVSPVKMEYGWNFSISGLKMMVKSGLEKIFLKFLHALTIFY